MRLELEKHRKRAGGLARILEGSGRREDLDLLLDVCDNISPGILWPPRQTTICPLGPSTVSCIASLHKYFKDEIQARFAVGAAS